MSITIKGLRRPAARRLLLGSLVLGAAATVAACSSSSPGTAAGSPGRATASASSAAAVTISAKSVPGVGTILVNGQGQTLYLLTSEQGGKITCTKASGCTKFCDSNPPASGSCRRRQQQQAPRKCDILVLVPDEAGLGRGSGLQG